MNVTTTTLGFQKLAGFFYSGLGATYTTTVSAGTGEIKSFNVLKRPLSGSAAGSVGVGGGSGTVVYTEESDVEFELEVWGQVTRVGTFVITSVPTGGRQGSGLASYEVSAADFEGNINPKTGALISEKIYFCRCPMIYIGGGFTINNNGAFTLTTALTRSYAHCYMYFDAARIAAGVPAGWYYVQMTTTAAGTVFNNVYTTGNCSIPTTPVAFVTTGAGAGANPLSTAIAGFNFNFVGGSMGNNGIFKFEGLATSPGGASVKDLTAHFDLALIAQYGMTSIQHYAFSTPLRNMSEQIRQSAPRQNTGGLSAGGLNSVDTNMMWNCDLSINKNFNFRFNVAAATDYIVLLVLDVTITRID